MSFHDEDDVSVGRMSEGLDESEFDLLPRNVLDTDEEQVEYFGDEDLVDVLGLALADNDVEADLIAGAIYEALTDEEA